MKINKETVKNLITKIFFFFFNPHLLLCVFIAWMITNGWCYVFLGLGTLLNIKWMVAVGTVYASLLWLPFTPEKIITVFLAIFFLKRLFPNDKKTLKVLHDDYEKLKQQYKNRKSK